MKVKFNINGESKELDVESNKTLLSTLRDNGYNEVKCGCNEGECGACLVLLEGKTVNSCQVLAMSAGGKNITTVKGIGTIYMPHIIQKEFVKAGADQCGFCSPGMIVASYDLLNRNINPSRGEVVEALDGNLCRCTGYVKIIDAVLNAAKYIRMIKK